MTSPKSLKATANGLLDRLAAGTPAAEIYTPDAEWRGPHPLNERTGADTIDEVWNALRHSFPDLERRVQILVAGPNHPDPRVDEARPAELIATLGTYMGTFREDFLGIPATQGAVQLRAAEVHELSGGKISKSWVLWDFLDLMRQAGFWPFPPSLGAEGRWSPPATSDGFRLGMEDDVEVGNRSMELVLAMHQALGAFDGKHLDSMPHGKLWTPDFIWYGPSGIGTTRGLEGFRAHHQIPFLRAFPDRAGSGHYIRIGDGPYVVTGGWPSVTATHKGAWLGMTPTGRRIGMRVMDFYRLEGDLIAENWVPIDVIHIALQMGNDIFARLRHWCGNPDLAL